MNKITKNILRVWISIASIIIFGIGWITLAHAQKPTPLNIQTVEVYTSTKPFELAPILSFEDLIQSPNRPTVSQPNVNINMPRLRTRGS